jgi:hypothetical protein
MSESVTSPTLSEDEAKDLDSKLQGFSGSLSDNQRKYLAYALHLADNSDTDVQGYAWNPGSQWSSRWSTWSWE